MSDSVYESHEVSGIFKVTSIQHESDENRPNRLSFKPEHIQGSSYTDQQDKGKQKLMQIQVSNHSSLISFCTCKKAFIAY